MFNREEKTSMRKRSLQQMVLEQTVSMCKKNINPYLIPYIKSGNKSIKILKQNRIKAL
jgi:hypothetical protein